MQNGAEEGGSGGDCDWDWACGGGGSRDGGRHGVKQARASPYGLALRPHGLWLGQSPRASSFRPRGGGRAPPGVAFVFPAPVVTTLTSEAVSSFAFRP